MSKANIKEVVREKYGQAALRVQSGATGSCCDAPGLDAPCDPITSNLYTAAQQGELPDTAINASLGCGNPTALAELKHGETVLDLGSGGGVDVLLSARRVGPTGKAYGLDMTDEMLALAEENKRKSGLPMSSSSKVRSRTSHFQTAPWTSSSPTVSSTFRATKIVCSKKHFGCSNRRDALRGSDVVVRGKKYLPRSRKALSCGLAAWQAP